MAKVETKVTHKEASKMAGEIINEIDGKLKMEKFRSRRVHF